MASILKLLPALGVLVVFAACAGGQEETVPATTTSGQVVQVTARDLSFSLDTIRADPGKAFTINLANNDTRPHNLHIYKQKGGDSVAVINPTRVEPGQTGTLTATIQKRGEYYFQCDIHPSRIVGKLLVGVAGAAAGGSTPPATPGGGYGY